MDIPGVAGFFGIDQMKYTRMTNNELQTLVGKTITENAFTSCGSAKGCGFTYSNIINIYCSKGPKMIYTEPFSHYGGSRGEICDGQSKTALRSELETLIQRGTTYRVVKVERVYGRTFIDIEVVAQ